TVARDLLTDSGSIFVQIGDENVHRVRAVLDEVFGDENFVSLIPFQKTSGQTTSSLPPVCDYLVWYTKNKVALKFRQPWIEKKETSELGTFRWIEEPTGLCRRLSADELRSPESEAEGRMFRAADVSSQTGSDSSRFPFLFHGKDFIPSTTRGWSTSQDGLKRLAKADKLLALPKVLCFKRFYDSFPVQPLGNLWTDTVIGTFSTKTYVVQTAELPIQRCILMTTDPGDLVLDPTCGSGTTAYVAEQWGRRWITIDTSRVALALARTRIMGARYPFYLLADSQEGQIKESEVTRTAQSSQPVHGNIRHGFVYERVPHITLKSIANNSEIDVIWEKWLNVLEPLREKLNSALKKQWQEWEIPREADAKWPEGAKKPHADWWQARIARQKEIDASIAAKAEFEYLYDKPYDDKKKVRVAGPFTVESLSPHRVLGVDENDELIDTLAKSKLGYGEKKDFAQMILENLKTAGVQQANKEDRITFIALTPWPGDLVCADGRYMEGETEKRAAIFIGPEFGTVQRADLVAAAREAGDAGFDVLIACAFNYEAHTTEFSKLGRIPVLKARMNADLHMAEDLKNTGKGNLFVIFGEPDITFINEPDGKLRVKVNGVDVFKPQTGEVISDGADGIACWFIDTDYNEESFFVRHAYFLGANDPYSALKTTLKAEIDPDAWATLNSDTSRPFDNPVNGRIAVKVINHLGDEVMKVFKVVKDERTDIL
ncbi:MAG: DNA methyltransferase, partial [Candidatus Latescibacterota bacterium]